MTTNINTKDKELYPVTYNGELWNEDECDDVFTAFYTSKESLNYASGVYVGDDMWVYPDGHFSEW